MAHHSLDVIKRFCFTLLLLGSALGSAPAQVESVTVTQVSAQLIAPKKVATYETRSMPSTMRYAIQGYEYRIKLEFYSTDLDLQTSPMLFVVCFLPGQTIQTIPMGRENIHMQSEHRYEYGFPLMISKKGETGFTIATENELPEKNRAAHFSRLSSIQKILLPLASDVE